jgi:hypothetical protein
MGGLALYNNTSSYNVAIGGLAGYTSTSAQRTVYIGFGSGQLATSSYNIGIGMYSVKKATGSDNIGIGYEAIVNTEGGQYNVAIGRQAGYSNVAGSSNVFIGYQAGYNETGSNKLYIANSDTSNPLIGGDFSTGKVEISGGTGEIEAINTKMTAWKSHITGVTSFTGTTDWEDLTWNLKMDDECLSGISYYDEGGANEDKSIIVIDGFNDIFEIKGCTHTYWGGSQGQPVKYGTRVLYSTDSGSNWTEARCLQIIVNDSKATDAEGTYPFVGSIKVDGTTWIKLQGRTTDVDLDLRGDSSWLDNPVGATIWMENIGNNRQIT